MNKFFVLTPEVAGGLGPHTVMDRSTHPPTVSKLHYEFDGWLGDEIVESFPCILATESLTNRLRLEQVVGMEVADAEVSITDQFREVCPGVELPRFVWLKATGCAGVDDNIAIGPRFRLVVSERVLRVIQATRPRALEVEEL
jgi:hypothetical protein